METKSPPPLRTPCSACPLRGFAIFSPMTADEVAFMQHFKTGEASFPAGATILADGAACTHTYTVLRGMGLRYKLSADGRRQVLNFLFPGDFIGIEGAMGGELTYSVRASTPVTLCVFDNRRLAELFRNQPRRAFDLAWVIASEKSFLAEALTTVGQTEARHRIAWALMRLYARAASVGLAADGTFALPFRQSDLADALGLSLVHTNKMLARMRCDGLATWSGGALQIHDLARLAELAQIDATLPERRPLV